ncbi:MAG TPA: glycosyltransferase family 39 protein, partial [Crinalium sp.]
MANQRVRMSRLRLICIVLLVIGLLFRVINLDRKVYWHDEAYASLEITAHTRSEIVANSFTAKEVTVDELQRYQRLDPNRGFKELVLAIGREDPQHPPLYYILGRIWQLIWGDNNQVIATRSLSVVLSFLVFPAVYWLCLELFESSLTGWVAIALIAISPLHVLYAQEAREYGFWTALVAFSSAALLRAMRRSNWLNWGVYCGTLILSFYTALFSGLVAFANGVYVLINNRSYTLSVTGFRLDKRAIAYSIAVLVAVIAFIPWIYFLVTSASALKASTEWITVSLPLLTVLKSRFMNLTRIFADFDLSPFDQTHPYVYLSLAPILILELYALYFLCRTTPKRVWSF